MDWHAAYAARMNIVADVIREDVLTRTGAKTENVLLRKIIHIVMNVKLNAEKDCCPKSNLMGLPCLSKDTEKKNF